jgi:hypothetical protein
MPYQAKEADLRRGWGKSCDKSCAAKRRDFGGKPAKRADGKPLPTVKKKGANRIKPDTRVYATAKSRYDEYDYYDDCNDDPSWDAHKDY